MLYYILIQSCWYDVWLYPHQSSSYILLQSCWYNVWLYLHQAMSVIFGRITKSLKMVLRPPPRALVKIPLFLGGGVKGSQTSLKSMHLSPFVLSVIFGRITKSLTLVLRPPPPTLVKIPLFSLFGVGV